MTDAPQLVREVAAPGSVFWETVRHPENIEILEGDERARTLPADKLEAAQKQLDALQAGLNVFFRAYAERLRRVSRQIDDPDKRKRIDQQIAEADKRIKPVRRAGLFGRKVVPVAIKDKDQAREALVLAARLRARIDEHYRALENDKLNIKLQNEMLGEINFYARQIIERWSSLGYREEYFVDGKRILRKVQIEEAHFTEDTIQFKIYVSDLTLLGSVNPHLPDKVRAWDLVKPETLKELEAATECPVTSPHTEDEQGFEKGAWVVVYRVGMRDGLFNYVELNKVLPKYNQALRPYFAVPVGIKNGRLVEYLRLDRTFHIMFNGITGSGKSNIARVMLATWAQFYSPDEIRFVLIDLKRSGDFNYFDRLPHMVGGIVKTVAQVEDLLPRIVALMYERMERFSSVNVTDRWQYNAKVVEAERMPILIVLIDECGSINDAAQSDAQRKRIWSSLTLLAMVARASGIVLMLGTQQPSKDAMPPGVANNITYTISGRQRTMSGAMMATSNTRTKHLPAIQGRMLIDNGFDVFPVQTPYATNDDLARAVKLGMDYPEPRPLVLPGFEEAVAMVDAQASGELDTTEKHIDESTGVITRVPAAAPPALGVTRERLIALTLVQLGGVFSARKTYDLTAGVTPRAAIEGMIKQLVDEKEIVHDGERYTVKKHGKGFRLAARKTESLKVDGDDSGFSSEDISGFSGDGISETEAEALPEGA